MEQWEYWTGFLEANAATTDVREYLTFRWPDWKPRKYEPQAMIPALDSFGSDGWELVHLEPVPAVGSNADVGFPSGTNNFTWSNKYFCVFKRRK